MIVDAAPRLTRIVAEVWRPLTILFLWDVAVTAFYWISPFRAPALPLTLFGSALALFLGARVNSAYQRWWEGRNLWGALINTSRSLARTARALLEGDDDRRALARDLVRRQIAYAHMLRRQLRRQPPLEDAAAFLEASVRAALAARTNPANALLDGIAVDLAAAQRAGWIDTIQQSSFDRILLDLANAQGGMERLKNTPLPNQYRFFPVFFTRLFCVLLPIGLVETLGLATPVGSTIAGLMFLAALAIGDDLVDPFADTVHDVPLTAMCRTIEIDLLQGLGETASAPATPEKGVLW